MKIFFLAQGGRARRIPITVLDMDYQTIVGSTFAGIVSTTLGHPLDSIKTHLQTNSKFHYSIQVIRTIRLGLFRGITPPLVNAIVMNTVMFSVFDRVRQSTNNPFVAGIISGFATAMISTPTDYIKIQAQLSSPTTTKKKTQFLAPYEDYILVILPI